ncbi:MAG TPA: hypothetical protein VFR19_25930 [Hyphomicrobiaceae bacterium]|jgi:protein involved in polysaccharide export with SLBB domain|nr:hypothetical protein [Hyphomicrobiaceae bacterium]
MPTKRAPILIGGKWDYDRGLIIKESYNVKIFMYVDDPGRYFDPAGNEVSDAVANSAGFDVTKDRAKRRLTEAKRKAEADLEAKIKEEFARIDREHDYPPQASEQKALRQTQEHPDLTDRRIRQNPNMRGR